MRGGGPSVTAKRVAAHRLDATRLERPSGRPQDDDALARDVAGGTTVPPGRMHDYLLARTAFIDRVVVGALDRGVDQIVLLGAGYDGRALRYAGDAPVFFEVDHPDTQADKLERLRRLRLDASKVRFVAADFRCDDPGSLLVGAGLDPTRPSLFVLEGVASYLDVEVLAALLRSIRAVAGPASRLAITLSVTPPALRLGARLRRRQFRRAVAAVGEPIRNTLSADGVDGLLREAGWCRTVSRAPGTSHDRGRALGFVLAEPAER